MKNTHLIRSFYVAVTLCISTFVFTGCDSSDTEEPFSLSGKGVFIVNEGNFGTPNGSISFYHKASDHIENDIFSKNNDDQLLGDVIQSMTLFGDRAFIIANNSNKIEVVEKQTFKSVATIEGLMSPRYFVALNQNKGYVTEWVAYGSNGRVSVIDLKTNTVTKTITVGAMPEQLILANGKIYVANSGGKTITVINTATDAVENTFETPDSPSEFVQDKDNHIWVLCSGKVVYTDDWSAIDYTQTTPGALAKLNPTANAIENTYTFPSNQSIPKNLSVNGAGDKLYYTYLGKTYSQEVNATQLTSTVVIGRSFYGMEVDPETGNIYGSDNNNFSSDGTVFIYSPTGAKLKEFKAGIGPNGFVFN